MADEKEILISLDCRDLKGKFKCLLQYRTEQKSLAGLLGEMAHMLDKTGLKRMVSDFQQLNIRYLNDDVKEPYME